MGRGYYCCVHSFLTDLNGCKLPIQVGIIMMPHMQNSAVPEARITFSCQDIVKTIARYSMFNACRHSGKLSLNIVLPR